MTAVFRAYDVRGIYGKDLTDEIAEKIGKAFGTFVGYGKSIAVGRDVRLSGNNLRNALIKGLLSAGCNVADFGIIPTPVLYFSVIHRNLDAGIMITASHLPPEWNGFKMCDLQGIVYSDGTGLEHIKEIFEKEKFFTGKQGNIAEDKKILDDYKNFIKSKISAKRKLKIVVDPANSVTSLVVPNMLEDLGFEVYKMHDTLDGNFPNRASEPTEESLQKLKKKVLEVKADLGLGFDGDGDRVGFVDEKGKIIFSGNIVIPIFASYLLENGSGRKIVFDVTCSEAVEDFVKSKGGIPVVIRVGHSYCSHTVLKENALFGGQFSGHYAFPEMGCTDDAIYAALKLVEIVSNGNQKFSEIISKVPSYHTSKMEEITCDDKTKFEVVEKIKQEISPQAKKLIDVDGMKAYFDKGWILIRASNTAPMIRVLVEGKTEKDMQQLFEYGKQLVKEEISKI